MTPVRLLSLLLACAAVSPTFAQPLPAPEAYLGYPIGSKFTFHANAVSYARLAAERSDRITLTEYGRTFEGRPLLYLTITSPENHGRMATIRANKAKIADPRLLRDGDDLEKIIADTPVVAWMSYNVHGNEASPMETALKVIHRFATAADAETTRWLDEGIIILDPCINPDGRDRYAQWYNSVIGRRPDPDLRSAEHDEPWPGGRYNHWYFDLNRDWAFATQPETRARHPHFVAWTPQVHGDFHEMGLESSYFFFPAEKPVNANLPAHTLKWGKRFGAGNAKAFDERGWEYFTAESYDLFYPGYGDSWPSFAGAIGMTYEQGGHGRAGAAARRRDGSMLTLEDRLEHHEIATYATIKTAIDNRVEFLSDYQEFRASAVEEGRTGKVRAVILPAGSDPARADALVDTLLLQGIEVRRTTAPITLARGRDYHGKEVLDRTFPAGTYFVDYAQPLKRLATTLLEPRTEIRELYFYDISAWSFPLAYHVDAIESPVAITADSQPVTVVTTRDGSVESGAKVAWLLRYDTQGALGALADMLRAGLKVRSARKSFTLEGVEWDRGTLVVRSGENPRSTETLLRTIAKARGVHFRAANSGYTEKGIDLGSRSVSRIVRPRIALVGGEGISSTSFGSTRFFLDQVMDLPYSYVTRDSLGSLDLDRFTAVVVPEGSLDADARKALAAFASSGGVVVACGRSAFSMCGEGGARVSAKAKAEDGKKAEKEKPGKWIEDRDAHRRANAAPGSMFRIELDPAHPIAFGYRSEIAAFHSGTRSFDPAGPGTHVGLFVEAAPISGYVPPKAAKALEGRAYVSVESRGRGAIVLFADDPNFRGAWRGLSRMFMNATLLLPSRHLTPPLR